ncbi:MAG TPA: GNAT family N-acetyltransferase [Burkholderiales bacterium]|nr:GNAT family N-acetyltransferase [Burkholderiales bacterium]
MNPSYRVRQFGGFADLPPAYRALLDGEIERHGFFREPDWFDYLMRNFFDDGDRLRLAGVEEIDTGRPVLLAPLRDTTSDYAVRKGRLIGSVSDPENYATAALMFDQAVEEPVPILEAMFRHFRSGDKGEHPGRIDAIRIWPVERHSRLGDAVYRALRGAGFLIQAYANSFNYFEDTTGLSYADYFARRSANLRYSVRRRQRALEKTGGLEFALASEPADVGNAAKEYAFVSHASWKTPGTMLAMQTLRLMHLCARKGCLRLGILRLAGVPVAAQFWIVSGGAAHCIRLAYHEDYKKLAVGVVLTNFMIAHVLDQDRVREIAFGVGRDEYKSGWMKDTREYYGFIAFNPSTPLGLLYAFRHIQGRRAKRLIKWGLGLVRRRRAKETETVDAK